MHAWIICKGYHKVPKLSKSCCGNKTGHGRWERRTNTVASIPIRSCPVFFSFCQKKQLMCSRCAYFPGTWFSWCQSCKKVCHSFWIRNAYAAISAWTWSSQQHASKSQWRRRCCFFIWRLLQHWLDAKGIFHEVPAACGRISAGCQFWGIFWTVFFYWISGFFSVFYGFCWSVS